MQTYIKYPPRKAQSETYTGPITISGYQRFQWVREKLQQEGFDLPLPTGTELPPFRLPSKCSTRAARFERPSAFLAAGLRCNADNPKERMTGICAL